MPVSPTQPSRITCTACHTILPEQLFNRPSLVSCPTCDKALMVSVFPALYRAIETGKHADAIIVDGESSCFYHPEKRAEVACERCGRFLCSLCDLKVAAEHLCPGCLHAQRDKGKLPSVEQRRTLFDSTALLLAVVPLILAWPLTFATAPIAIALAIYSFKKPISMVARTRWRAYVALIVAVPQVIGWLWGLVMLIMALVD